MIPLLIVSILVSLLLGAAGGAIVTKTACTTPQAQPGQADGD